MNPTSFAGIPRRPSHSGGRPRPLTPGFKALLRLLVYGLLLGLGSGALEACSPSGSDDDTTHEPTATPLPSFVEHPHTWAMVRQLEQEVYLYESPVTTAGWYRQAVRFYSLVTWEDGPGDNDNSISIRQTETLCDAQVSDIEIDSKFGARTLSTIIPAGLISSVPPDVWTGRVNISTSPQEPPTYGISETLYSVWGAHLADPLQDRCPMLDEQGTSYNEDNLPPVEWDEDKDGNPGITIELYVDGTFFADTYICQRLNFTQTVAEVARIDGSYHIQGNIRDYLNDQSQYWSDPPKLDDQDPQVGWNLNADGADTYYILDELPEGATCSDVQAAFGL